MTTTDRDPCRQLWRCRSCGQQRALPTGAWKTADRFPHPHSCGGGRRLLRNWPEPELRSDPIGRPDRATQILPIVASAAASITGSDWPTRTGSVGAALDSMPPAIRSPVPRSSALLSTAGSLSFTDSRIGLVPTSTLRTRPLLFHGLRTPVVRIARLCWPRPPSWVFSHEHTRVIFAERRSARRRSTRGHRASAHYDAGLILQQNRSR